MSISPLADALPPYARDIAANLKALADETLLSDPQKWGALLACAYATGQPDVVKGVEDAARLDASTREAVKAATALSAMNTVYYRAIHRAKNPEFARLPAHLQMRVLADPGVDPADFELWSLALAAFHGCGVCLDSHEAELRARAMPTPAIQAAIRIAAVVRATAAVLAAEAAQKTRPLGSTPASSAP